MPVALKTTCSRRWEIPQTSGDSSLDPVLTAAMYAALWLSGLRSMMTGMPAAVAATMMLSFAMAGDAGATINSLAHMAAP